ncbi:FAD-binding oxidoreductase [Serinicoccus kebangsaanensis]|uniref:FAD-binding oxidoreductase n=1 Tax=Serinicoccus kebangsaanensis TaxID=2602069 RepID=UPI00124C2A76|nr:FAD-binding oxidoreductase [Serinicoccus kebangsaanensis]
MSVEGALSGVCAVRPAEVQEDVDGVRPEVVARPVSTQETSALMRACSTHGLRVVVRGHGSKLAWGAPPERVDVVLETTGMDGLVEHSRGDLIATAGAGMPLARLQQQLGPHQLVVDDLASGRGRDGQGSTLGGAIATNLSGARRLWAGPLRDLVIGMRVVLADGTVAKAGGKVVKNVAGYDLAKLLTGSYGTLAVITEATVRLHPVPEATRWVRAPIPPSGLAPALRHVIDSQLVPHAVEVHATPAGEASVGVCFGGTADGTRARADTLAAELQEWAGGTVEVETVEDAETDDRPAPTSPLTDRPTLVRTTSRLSGIPELVAVATGHGMTVTGSAGVGVLRATLPEDTAAQAVAEAVQALRETSARLGGSTVVLDAPPSVKPRLDLWGPVPGLALMRRVKAEFDPGRLLAPGRFVGGL